MGASGVESVWGEVSQESQKNPEIRKNKTVIMTTGYRERPDRDGCRARGDRGDRRDRGDPREGREGEGRVGVGPPRDRDTLRTPIKGLLIGVVFFPEFF